MKVEGLRDTAVPTTTQTSIQTGNLSVVYSVSSSRFIYILYLRNEESAKHNKDRWH